MTIRDVAYVVNTFPKLSETFVSNEIAALVRRGIRVRVLSLKAATETIQHPIVATLPLDTMRFTDEGAFRRSLAAARPDVVHAHFATEPTRVAGAIARDLGVPFSFTAHGYDVYRKPPADLAERIRHAAAVVTVSAANVDHLEAAAGADRTRVQIVPCGVDLDEFRPDPARVEPATIVCVARLRPVKNLGMLIEACRLLAVRGIPARAVVIGEGPSLPELEAHRTRVGLDARHVAFLGAADQSAVRGWWQRATVGTLTSVSEGMPVSLMEAAACGVPVVAPSVGGIPELVADGLTGFITAPGDATAVADGLARLLTSPALRATMSLAARARAEAHFSLAQQVETLVRLWSQLSVAVTA